MGDVRMAYHLESDSDDESMWRFNIGYNCEHCISYKTSRGRCDTWCIDRNIKSSPSYIYPHIQLIINNNNITETTHIAKAHDLQQ